MTFSTNDLTKLKRFFQCDKHMIRIAQYYKFLYQSNNPKHSQLILPDTDSA